MKPTHAEKRNVLLLASTQALFQTASVMVMTLSGLAGLQLAPDKSLATLPIAMMMVAAAATMIPAAMLMQRFGRKTGFLLGTSLGILAGLTSAGAIWLNSFWLFVAGNMLVGTYQGFAQYYRFAAADGASGDFKSRAISWVVAGRRGGCRGGTQHGPVHARDWPLAVYGFVFGPVRLEWAGFAGGDPHGDSTRGGSTGQWPGSHPGADHAPAGVHHRADWFIRRLCGDGHGDDGHAASHANLRPTAGCLSQRDSVACAGHVFCRRSSRET
jgi:MFS family permease